MAQLADQSGKATASTPEQFLESLGRLSKKAGVIATVVLDRSSGAILTTTGTLTPNRSSSASTIPLGGLEEAAAVTKENQGVEDMAAMTWNFIRATGDLVHGLDTEDEIKLLRLRTKKYELVIVPDPKYLLIVVHETPAV